MALASALSHLHIGGGHGQPDVLGCHEQLHGAARLGRGLHCELPAIPPDQLEYTQRDWARWDTFDLAQYTVDGVKRRQHGLGGGDNDELLCEQPGACCPGVAKPKSAEQCYFHLFRLQVLHTFWRESHSRFRRLQKVEGGVDDFLARLQKDKQMPVDQVANYLSNNLSQEYNHWRIAQRNRARAEVTAAHQAQGGAIDVAALDRQVDMLIDSTPFDPRKEESCAPTVRWFNELTRVHLGFQCLDPALTVDKGSPFGTWKPYGQWANPDGSYEQQQVFWRCPGIGVIYGHYCHLLDDALIRAVRRAMHASLAAQYAWHAKTGTGTNHHGESQWLLRIAGFVLHAFVLRRSEAELRARGAWTDADEVKVTDREAGLWVTAELVAFSESLLTDLEDRMRLFGQTEFLSSYYGYVLDLLGDLQLHAPSQKCYDLTWRLIERMQWDMAANLMSGSGTFSGPSGRSYDLFAGCHNMQDRVDFHMYFKHVFEPYCRAGAADAKQPQQELLQPDRQQCTMRTRSDGTQLRAELLMEPLLAQVCAWNGNKLPTLLPPSGDIDPNWHRLWMAHSQLAGTGSLPFRPLERLPLATPFRVVEQRFSRVVGQERFNFLTPTLQMGHAGEDTYSLPTALLACARLSGSPLPNTPIAQVNHGVTNCHSFVRLFSRVGADPDPCKRAGHVAGDNRQALSRQIVSQYQGWMLITHLLAPVTSMNAETMAGSWDSNLMLPLSVEMLRADEVDLPRTVGTRLRIHPSAIFHVRHQGSSIVVRIPSFTKEDDIPHSDKIAAYGPGEEHSVCSVEWVVDESAAACGVGRIVVHHRRKEGSPGAPAQMPPVKPYRIAWLWGSGVTATDGEAQALATLLRQAHIAEQVAPSPEWNERDQPRDKYPATHPPDNHGPVAHQRWSIAAHIASGALKLSVARTDVYYPFQHAEEYRTPQSGPMHARPYCFKDVERRVNDQEILRWAEGEEPYRVRGFAPDQIFEPHRQGKCAQVFPTQPVSDNAAQGH